MRSSNHRHITAWPFESPACCIQLSEMANPGALQDVTARHVEHHAYVCAAAAPDVLARQCLNRTGASHVPDQHAVCLCLSKA